MGFVEIISSFGDVMIGDAPNGDGYGAGYEPRRSSMPMRGLSGSWLNDERSDIVLPVLALRVVRGAGDAKLCSTTFVTRGEVALADVDESVGDFSSSFFEDAAAAAAASSSSCFFGFLGTPNALSQAFRFGVADLSVDLSVGDDSLFVDAALAVVSIFSVVNFSGSAFSLRSFSFDSNSVDVTISSNSMSSEQASLELSHT